MPVLFAFWPLDAHGRPHPDAAAPWGERCPFDALDAYPRASVGPWLTVVDDATEVVRFAGDASRALRLFAADVASDSGRPADPAACPLDQALDACRSLADEATDEAGREAVAGWREPDPDTWRQGAIPPDVRRAIRHHAEAVGREAAGQALRDHLTACVLTTARLAA